MATAGKRRASKKQAADGSTYGPTHYLKMKTTEHDESGWTTVGAAWQKSSGLISIRLNRGVVLDWHDFAPPAEFTLILVPAD